EWLQEVALALEDFPYLKLRFVIHEAFVNACKYSLEQTSDIIIVIHHKDSLEISITDSGKGFLFPEELGNFDARAIGLSWKLASDRDTNVMAKVEDPYTLTFSLRKEATNAQIELMENHRGLISILKSVKNLTYHYVPNSY